MKIAGVVVLYNPVNEVLKNIKSYCFQVDRFYVFDNSDRPNYELLADLKGISCAIYTENNVGIAAALNKIASIVVQDCCTHLLTMDQDSFAPPNLVKELSSFSKKGNNVGIISPFHASNVGSNVPQGQIVCDVSAVMTSGSLFTLSALKTIGGFDENLFIDYVDTECCWRMKLGGFNVLELNSVSLQHNLGNISKVNLFSRRVHPQNHSPLRMYYMTRNLLYLNNRYKSLQRSFVQEEIRKYLLRVAKIILFEKWKIAKLKMIVMGYIHFKRRIMGKYLAI